jgi:hypothetical protein
MNADHVSELRALVQLETTARIALGLKEVTLVDREAVASLARIEAAGVTATELSAVCADLDLGRRLEGVTGCSWRAAIRTDESSAMSCGFFTLPRE